MTYKIGNADSDSVNLGSNPSSPANENADVSGTSRNPGAAEISERPEQTAHTGRTESGTAYRAAVDRLNRITDAELRRGPHLISALRARGHAILAAQLWLALRYPSAALRNAVAGMIRLR